MGNGWLLKFVATVWLSFTLVWASYGQQDPLYSQYHFNQLVINPAYAGLYNNTSFSFISRIQWALTGIQGTPFTNTFTAQSSIIHDKVGVGLIVVQDFLGVAENYEFYAPITYKINWQDKSFSFGLQPGFQSINYNFDQLNLKSSDDPAFQGNISTIKPNIGTGVALMSDTYFIGFSIPRLLKTEFADGVSSSLRYERHMYGTIAYMFDVSSFVRFKPSVLLRFVEGAPMSYDINAIVLLNEQIWTGVYTRSFESLGLMFQWDFKDAYRIGYNFEFPIANSLPFGYTTHEFMFSVDLKLFKEQDIFQRYF